MSVPPALLSWQAWSPGLRLAHSLPEESKTSVTVIFTSNPSLSCSSSMVFPNWSTTQHSQSSAFTNWYCERHFRRTTAWMECHGEPTVPLQERSNVSAFSDGTEATWEGGYTTASARWSSPSRRSFAHWAVRSITQRRQFSEGAAVSAVRNIPAFLFISQLKMSQ